MPHRVDCVAQWHTLALRTAHGHNVETVAERQPFDALETLGQVWLHAERILSTGWFGETMDHAERIDQTTRYLSLRNDFQQFLIRQEKEPREVAPLRFL